MERTRNCFVRMFQKAKRPFLGRGYTAFLACCGLDKAAMNPTAMRDISVFKGKISLYFGKVIVGEKKVQRESVDSP